MPIAAATAATTSTATGQIGSSMVPRLWRVPPWALRAPSFLLFGPSRETCLMEPTLRVATHGVGADAHRSVVRFATSIGAEETNERCCAGHILPPCDAPSHARARAAAGWLVGQSGRVAPRGERECAVRACRAALLLHGDGRVASWLRCHWRSPAGQTADLSEAACLLQGSLELLSLCQVLGGDDFWARVSHRGPGAGSRVSSLSISHREISGSDGLGVPLSR
jgi:hypothetical protein